MVVLHLRRLLMPPITGSARRNWKEAGDFAALLLCFALELLLSWDKVAAPFPGGAWLVPWLVLLLYAPLPFRRKRPVAVFTVTAAGSAALSLLVPGFVPLFGVWLALYTVALLCPRIQAAAAAAAACGLILLNVLVEVGRSGAGQEWDVATVGAVGGAVITLAVFGLGRWVAWSVKQRRRAARYAAERAIRDERSRIARELHDVVAHAVSLMVLQTAGAARIMQANPRQAAEALENVSLLGQQAVVELRRMLGLLYDGAPAASADSWGQGGGPHARDLPSISRLEELVKESERAGLAVELQVTGAPVLLEPGVDLSAYRVVQEALTNASRYSAAGHGATVSLHWQASGVQLEVRNRCLPGALHHPLSSGHGLVGMAERAKAADGWVKTGRRGDEFVVQAGFPAGAPSRRGTPAVHGGR